MSLKQKITTDKAPVMLPGMFFDNKYGCLIASTYTDTMKLLPFP
jgi:hypothetical protein